MDVLDSKMVGVGSNGTNEVMDGIGNEVNELMTGRVD